MTIPAKRKIHKFDFKSEGAHVALVDRAANLQEVLSMKAADPEVVVSMSMREFLEKFFHLWETDAAILAKILGFEGEIEQSYDTANDYIDKMVGSVSVIKGYDSLPEKLPESVYNMIEELQSKFESEIVKSSSEDSPLEDNINIEKGESQVDKTEIEIKELETLKAQAEEVEAMKAKLAEMETLKSLVDQMKAEKEQKRKEETVELVKGYSFLSEEDQSALVEFLLKTEDNGIVQKSLEKARDAISAVVEEEQGAAQGDVDLSEEQVDKCDDLTAQILKNRKAK